MITISKNGGMVDVVDDSNSIELSYLLNSVYGRFEYDTTNDTVDVHIGEFFAANVPLSNLTIAGAVPANKAEFYAKQALVFPDAAASALTTVATDGTLSGNGSVASPLSASSREATANKDATGGYAGLTLFKINFKNALNTFISFFTNANTAARTYTFQDRNGTIADDTDLASKQASLGFTAENSANKATDFSTVNNTKYPTVQAANTAINTAISALVNSSPGTLDTLKELADALGDDANFATTMTNSLAAKLAIANNLSDLANAGTARTNLGIANFADKTIANTFTPGAKQTLGTDATNAGMRFTGVTANPSALVEGDEWYRTDEKKFRYYDGTTVRAFVTEALAQTITNKIISGANNTLSAIDNASLSNSAITINGVSTALGGSFDGRPKSASVSGSDVTTTLATAVDVTGLSIAVAANKKYRIIGEFWIDCNNTGGVKLAVNGPAGSVMLSGSWVGDGTSANAVKGGKTAAMGTLSTTFNLLNSSAGWVKFGGYLTTSSTAGNIVIQFASGVAAETSKVLIGSTFDLTEVQ